LDLRASLARQREAVDVDARLFLNEQSARVKLVMPCGARQAEFDVPGGRVMRGASGEVPGGRWVRTEALGFASNALYNFDLKNGALRATLARASRYSCDRNVPAGSEPWTPTVDVGELRFKFLLAPGDEQLPLLARQLEEPPLSIVVPPSQGELPCTGSLLELQPASVRVLSLAPDGDGGLFMYVQEMNGKTVTPRLKWLGQTLKLDKISAGQIARYRLTNMEGAWAVHRQSN
jgi:alpha-mannosidase